jgi:hypothetical protein
MIPHPESLDQGLDQVSSLATRVVDVDQPRKLAKSVTVE